MDYQQIQDKAKALIQEENYEGLIDLYIDALEYDFPESVQGEFLSALGELFGHFGDKQKAIDHYSAALEIFRKEESKEGEGNYFAVMAAVANNLGILHEEMNDDVNAADRFMEAMKNYEKLAKNKPEAYKPYVGTTYYNLGNLFGKKPDYYQSRKYFQKSYEVFEELAEANPDHYDGYKANALISLGNSYIEEHDYANAEIYFKRAVALYRVLTEKAFETFAPYLAATLNNLAVACKNTKQQDKAAGFYQETLELYTQLVEANPGAFLPYKAGTLNSMGILFSEMFDKDEAIRFYELAIKDYQQLSAQQPDHFNPYLATSIHNLAILLDDKGDLEKAEAAYHKSLYLRKSMAEKFPAAFDRDVSVTAMNLVTLYQQFLERHQKDEYREKAQMQLKDVKERLEKYDQTEPVIQSLWSDHDYFVNFFENVTTEDLKIANALRKVDAITEEINSTIDPGEKAGFQKQILQLLEEQRESYPDNQQLAETYSTELGNMAMLKIRLKNNEEAKTFADKGLEINPSAYWVRLIYYYLALIKKENSEAERILKEILAACPTELDKETVKEQIDKDLLKLRMDGMEV